MGRAIFITLVSTQPLRVLTTDWRKVSTVDLAERKFRILQAIIDDYIVTALPVGSRTISRKYEQKLSSATIRNEMSDLEELGYLDSPHTSAGRIPSYKAYRLYVDQLMERSPLGQEDAEAIRRHFDKRMGQMGDITARVASALSSVTQYTSIVMTQKGSPSAQRLKLLQLVPVTEHMALLMLVSDSGEVRQIPMQLGQHFSQDDLYQVSRMLTQRLAGMPMGGLGQALAQMSQEFEGQRELFGGMIEATEKAGVTALQPDIVVGGRSNILNYPEYSDVDKAKALLSVLETREKLLGLLGTGGSGVEFSVRIGPETGMPETQDCSVITASYRLGDGRVNTIGVIGPTRMQYGKVISVLDFMGKTLAQLLSEKDAT